MKKFENLSVGDNVYLIYYYGKDIGFIDRCVCEKIIIHSNPNNVGLDRILYIKHSNSNIRIFQIFKSERFLSYRHCLPNEIFAVDLADVYHYFEKFKYQNLDRLIDFLSTDFVIEN